MTRSTKLHQDLSCTAPEEIKTISWFRKISSWYICLTLLLHLIMHLPHSGGIPSRLHELNPELHGGRNWVATEGLPFHIITFAWTAFLGTYLMYFVVCILLANTARNYYQQLSFSLQSLRPLRIATWLYIGGSIVLYYLEGITNQAIQNTYGSLIIQGDNDSSFDSWLFLVTLCFLYTVLRRSVVLQDDVDSTI